MAINCNTLSQAQPYTPQISWKQSIWSWLLLHMNYEQHLIEVKWRTADRDKWQTYMLQMKWGSGLILTWLHCEMNRHLSSWSIWGDTNGLTDVCARVFHLNSGERHTKNSITILSYAKDNQLMVQKTSLTLIIKAKEVYFQLEINIHLTNDTKYCDYVSRNSGSY